VIFGVWIFWVVTVLAVYNEARESWGDGEAMAEESAVGSNRAAVDLLW
jgi:hypothetical protein